MQDNLSMITTQNGFGYRADDYGETLNASTTTLPPGNFVTDGIISTNTDKDAFKFIIAQNSSFHLAAVPFNVGSNYIGANLDIKIELYKANGNLINTYDPADFMSVTIDTVLNAGTYYIRIDGTGNVNTGEYGSLGSYKLSGVSAVLPIRDVVLTGNTDNNKHNLSWQIIADEPAKEIVIENSVDGVNYNNLAMVAAGTKIFSYSPSQNNGMYYRLKVISVFDQVVYSNAIVLKPLGKQDNIFRVSTLIQEQITVNAPISYQYLLSDINGRIISKGTGAAGTYKINISNQAKGIYIIQLTSNNKKQTERIIKQ
jgi:hypothetical protein